MFSNVIPLFQQIAVDLHEKDKQKRKSWAVQGLKEEHVKVEAGN